jgi:hypothetical protein
VSYGSSHVLSIHSLRFPVLRCLHRVSCSHRHSPYRQTADGREICVTPTCAATIREINFLTRFAHPGTDLVPSPKLK